MEVSTENTSKFESPGLAPFLSERVSPKYSKTEGSKFAYRELARVRIGRWTRTTADPRQERPGDPI
jgi:hypothetical protein